MIMKVICGKLHGSKSKSLSHDLELNRVTDCALFPNLGVFNCR